MLFKITIKIIPTAIARTSNTTITVSPTSKLVEVVDVGTGTVLTCVSPDDDADGAVVVGTLLEEESCSLSFSVAS